MIKPSKVIFADRKQENAYLQMDSNDQLKKAIDKAVQDIKKNAFTGEPISKTLIPKDYIRKYGINNIWIIDLTKGARLVYSVTTPTEVEILSIVIEYFHSHKEYERRFKY